jgi:electron transfer flavoprotein beta subunit
MRVLASVKRVPAPGARIALTEDAQAIDTTHLGFAMSPHEECAVEESIRIVEQHGGSATVLTLGPPEAEEQLRYSLSIGADEGVLVPTVGGDWDPQATATAIAAAVQQLEAADGPFDLLLFGNEAADTGGYQVGIRVAHRLGRPIVSGIKGIEIEDGAVTARRQTDDGHELYRLPLPAVLAVKEGLNLPRYPTLKGRLQSKKKEIARVESEQVPGGQAMVKLVRPPEQVTETEILGHGADAAPGIADLLRELRLA